MNREEAIKILSSYDVNGVWADVDGKPYNAEEQAEAFDMAIEALEQVTGKLNNPDDSLLTADSEACKEQKSKLDFISRAEAIEAIELVDWYHQNSNKDMVHGANDDEHQAWYKADDVYKALEAVPSADRPMVIKCEPFLSKEDFKTFAEQVRDQNVILIPHEAEVVSTNTSTKSTNISTDTSADRPKGKWIDEDNSNYANCSECGYQIDTHEERGYHNFCPNCGADMRGDTK